jgi:hypothetical protein
MEAQQVNANNTPVTRLHSWLASRPTEAEKLQLFYLPVEGAPMLVQEWLCAELPPPELSFEVAQRVMEAAHNECDSQGAASRFGVRFINKEGLARGQTTVKCTPSRIAQTEASAEHPFNFTDELDATGQGVLATSLRHNENMHRQTLIAQTETSKANREALALMERTNGQVIGLAAQQQEHIKALSALLIELVQDRHQRGGAGATEDDPVQQAHAVGIEMGYRALAEHVVPKLPAAAKVMFERLPTGRSKGGRNYKKKLPANASQTPSTAAAANGATNGNGKGAAH